MQAVVNVSLIFSTLIMGILLFLKSTFLGQITALAPFFIASFINFFPSTFSPLIAKNRSPFLILRLSKQRFLISIF